MTNSNQSCARQMESSSTSERAVPSQDGRTKAGNEPREREGAELSAETRSRGGNCWKKGPHRRPGIGERRLAAGGRPSSRRDDGPALLSADGSSANGNGLTSPRFPHCIPSRPSGVFAVPDALSQVLVLKRPSLVIESANFSTCTYSTTQSFALCSSNSDLYFKLLTLK